MQQIYIYIYVEVSKSRARARGVRVFAMVLKTLCYHDFENFTFHSILKNDKYYHSYDSRHSDSLVFVGPLHPGLITSQIILFKRLGKKRAPLVKVEILWPWAYGKGWPWTS
jgi:hypothetical protein